MAKSKSAPAARAANPPEEKDEEARPQPRPNNPPRPPAPTLLRLANTNPYTNLSDLTNESGRRLWRQATEPLVETFDGTHQHFQVFTANITNRFKMCNWIRFITFSIDNTTRDLITSPGLIPLPIVQESRLTRQEVLENPPDPSDNDYDAITTYNDAVIEQVHCTMMYHFLVNSIVTPLKTHISQKIMGGLAYEDGPILLKLIQQKVRGRANKKAVLNARSSLQSLNLKEFKYNIKKLHDHVNEQALIITSNGGEVQGDGITAALLKTYKSCNNEEFLHHIRHIESQADDHDDDIPYEDLMIKAETKYDTLCQTKVWGKKDPRDEQILALQAKIKTLQPSSTKSGSSRQSSGKNSSQKRKYPDWQYEKPKDGQTHRKGKNKKGEEVDYWWYEVLEMWARHKPEECTAKNSSKSRKQGGNSNRTNSRRNNSPDSNNQHNSNTTTSTPRLQASQTVLEDSDSSE